MSTKTMALGLALSGLALGTLGVEPARAQSALAQQAADQEKAGQQAKTPGLNPGTAKPAAANSAANATTSTKASATNATATKASATKPAATAKASTPAAKPATAKPAAKPVAKKVPAKPVVYLDAAPKGGANSATTAGSGDESKAGKSQNRDMAKAFEQSCPDVTVTEQRAKAGYNVTMEREPGSKGVKTVFGLTNVVHKTNKIEVTGKGGKEVFSEVGHSTEQLVKDACAAIATPPVKVARN